MKDMKPMKDPVGTEASAHRTSAVTHWEELMGSGIADESKPRGVQSPWFILSRRALPEVGILHALQSFMFFLLPAFSESARTPCSA
jgi:hypothetical protein